MGERQHEGPEFSEFSFLVYFSSYVQAVCTYDVHQASIFSVSLPRSSTQQVKDLAVCAASVWDVGTWNRVAIRHSELGGRGKTVHPIKPPALPLANCFLHILPPPVPLPAKLPCPK